MKRATLVWSKVLSDDRPLRSRNWVSGWKLMMSCGAKPYVAVTSAVWPAIRAICALVQVAPWPSGSKLTVTFDRFCLNLSLIWAIAFLNASALEPEFHAMTLMVTGPEPPAAAGAAAAGALVGGALVGGALEVDGAVVDWPHAAASTAPAVLRARLPRRRRRLT